MIGTIIATTIIALWVILMPSVTQLPYGLDEPLAEFMSVLNNTFVILPFMATIWNCFVIALGFRFALITLVITLRLWSFIRGSS